MTRCRSLGSCDLRSVAAMILYFAADLIWATKIKGTADSLGLACRPVRTPAMLEDRLADSQVTAVLVDLDVPETAMVLIARLKRENAEKARGIRIVAWGPHVEKALFLQAREAGA